MKNALFIFLFVFASNAVASTITLDATNSGHYGTNGLSNGNTANMLAGESLGTNFRNWIAFDLSSITDTILGATLAIANNAKNDANVDFTWSEITTSTSSLLSTSTNLFANLNVYTDLGDGEVFASGTASGGSIDSYAFNSFALASLNSSTNLWAIGGSTFNGTGSADTGHAYGFTGGVGSGDFIQLTLEISDSVPPSEVPVPAALWLFCSGLLTLFGFSARRKTS